MNDENKLRYEKYLANPSRDTAKDYIESQRATSLTPLKKGEWWGAYRLEKASSGNCAARMLFEDLFDKDKTHWSSAMFVGAFNVVLQERALLNRFVVGKFKHSRNNTMFWLGHF